MKRSLNPEKLTPSGSSKGKMCKSTKGKRKNRKSSKRGVKFLIGKEQNVAGKWGRGRDIKQTEEGRGKTSCGDLAVPYPEAPSVLLAPPPTRDGGEGVEEPSKDDRIQRTIKLGGMGGTRRGATFESQRGVTVKGPIQRVGWSPQPDNLRLATFSCTDARPQKKAVELAPFSRWGAPPNATF